MEKKPLTICITGAAGHIAYSLFPMLATGQIFGENTLLDLRLLDLPDQLNTLEGLKLEAEDSLFPCVNKIEIGTDPKLLFKNCDYVIFLGGSPRTPGMERRELLKVNCKIFKRQGKALNEVAKPTCRALVVANPCNTNCLILQKYCPNISSKNITCLSRLDHNRAIAIIANKAKVPYSKVMNIIIWGNHSNSQFPDLSYATIDGEKVEDMITDKNFLQREFVPLVQKRGGQILSIKKQTAVLSGAIAAANHLRDWHFGTRPGEWVSMGIFTDGTAYSVPEGLFFSMPVICRDGEYHIVKDLHLSTETKEKIKAAADELIEEKIEALEETSH